MGKKYEVTYYINREPHTFGLIFETAFGAIYTARSIFDRHGLVTDVMDRDTGEVVAIFEPGNTYMADEMSLEAKMMGLREIR